MKALRLVSFVMIGMLISGGQALAVAGHGPVWSADYVAAYQPTFGTQSVPYTGDLKLTFNHGIISGTYSSISARPDPYYGRIIQVSGGVKGSGINLRIGEYLAAERNDREGRNDSGHGQLEREVV